MAIDQRSDEDLVRLYLRGDEGAFELLVRRYVPPIHRFLARLAGDSHIAEDLAQETFVKVWRHLKKFDLNKSFKTWIFTIAKNAATDFFRKKLPVAVSTIESEEQEGFLLEHVQDERPLAPEILERQDIAREISDALATVNASTRTIILLHDAEGLTFQEIAEVLGEPMNTVKSRYRRGVFILRKSLNKLNNMDEVHRKTA